MTARTTAALLAALVVFVSLLSMPVGAAPEGGQLGAVTIGGEAVVATDTAETYLWQDERFTVNTSFATIQKGAYEFCLTADNGNETQRLSCYSQTIEGEETTDVGFALTNASGLSGPTNLTVTVEHALENNGTIDNRSVSVMVIRKQDDLDGDQLSNRGEVKRGTGINTSDTDNDTLEDGAEVNQYNTDPLERDTDGDGLSDSAEIGGESNTNPLKADSDNDGLVDGAEVNKHDTDPLDADTDDDGLSDGKEIAANLDPTSEDSDGDGTLDKVEYERGTTPGSTDTDFDNDGLSNDQEAKLETNESSADTDGDLLSDKTEVQFSPLTNPTSSLMPLAPVLGLVVVLVGLVAGARLRRHDDAAVRVPWTTAAAGDATDDYPSASATDVDSDATATTNGQHADIGDDSDGSENTLEGDDANAASLPYDTSKPLTDEDEVLKMLHESEGQLRQSEINDRTEWSKSKVSRLLSSMEEDGSIRKITLGRENLVTLANSVPKSAESPFDSDDR